MSWWCCSLRLQVLMFVRCWMLECSTQTVSWKTSKRSTQICSSVSKICLLTLLHSQWCLMSASHTENVMCYRWNCDMFVIYIETLTSSVLLLQFRTAGFHFSFKMQKLYLTLLLLDLSQWQVLKMHVICNLPQQQVYHIEL